MAEFRYKELKAKHKDNVRYYTTLHRIKKGIIDRFIWEGIDDYTPPTNKNGFIEGLLFNNGIVALGMIDGKLTFAPCSFANGLSGRFGVPESVTYWTNGGLSGNWAIGVDCVLLANDPFFFPDRLNIDRYAQLLSDIDLSIECLNLYGRLIPIPLVNTDGERSEYKDAIDRLMRGDYKIIKSMQLSDGDKLDLTSPDQVRNIECLSRLHDDIERRIYGEYGITISTKDKRAQISVEELDAFETLDGLMLQSQLKCRQDFVLQANLLFGAKISVTLNKMFDDLSNGRNTTGVIKDGQSKVKDNND